MWGMEMGRPPCSGNPQILSVDVKKADSDLDLGEGMDDGTVVRIRVCVGGEDLDFRHVDCKMLAE